MSFHESDAAAGGQAVHESTPTLNGVQMGFRAVDQSNPLISEPPEELRDNLPTMKVVHVDIVGGVGKARRTKHDIWKTMPLEQVNKRVVPKKLGNNNDAIQGSIAHGLFEVSHQGGIFMRFDIEAEDVICGIHNRMDSLD